MSLMSGLRTYYQYKECLSQLHLCMFVAVQAPGGQGVLVESLVQWAASPDNRRAKRSIGDARAQLPA